MASMGWGAVGGGAWGASPQPADDDVETAPPPPKSSAAPAFGTSNTFRANPVSSGPSTVPAVAPPVSFNTSSSINVAAKETELKKREAELAERERALAAREKELGVSTNKPNWPICIPVWYHNIGEEIPQGTRRVVREAYLCYLLLVFMLTYQFFCAAVMLGYNVSNKVPSFFLSIIFWLCGVVLAVVLWYKRLYMAAKEDSTYGFITFFIFFFLHWAFCVFCAIGVQINAAQWCFSGFMAAFTAFDASDFAGVIFLIGGGGWSVLALYSLWVLKDSWYFFRGQGGVKEVKEKAAREAALAAFVSQSGRHA